MLGIHAGIRDLEIYLTEKDMCALPFTSVEGPIIHHSNHALYGVLSVHLKSRLSFGSESYNESDNIRGKLFISNYVLDNLKEKGKMTLCLPSSLDVALFNVNHEIFGNMHTYERFLRYWHARELIKLYPESERTNLESYLFPKINKA